MKLMVTAESGTYAGEFNAQHRNVDDLAVRLESILHGSLGFDGALEKLGDEPMPEEPAELQREPLAAPEAPQASVRDGTTTVPDGSADDVAPAPPGEAS